MFMDNFVSSRSLAEGANRDGAISRFHNIKIIFSGALSEGGANLGGIISGVDSIYESIYII
jgi:hypothetical protein